MSRLPVKCFHLCCRLKRRQFEARGSQVDLHVVTSFFSNLIFRQISAPIRLSTGSETRWAESVQAFWATSQILEINGGSGGFCQYFDKTSVHQEDSTEQHHFTTVL
ncbi:unnamed protein product [Protopolystoma xenopodis]|uniref:Uncharacterized protein n=1 Tax=Protopolystoma xenopodis TaxID=117903 RepID=A0A3S5CV50_9PLAT|nr:unnamed protein product [Protopolystoma xenopodis]